MSIWDKIKDTASDIWEGLANGVVWIINKIETNHQNYEKNSEAGNKIIDKLQPAWWQKGINYVSDIWDELWLWNYNERVKEVSKDYITDMDSKIPDKLLNNWVTSTDIAHYLTNPNSVPEKKRKYLSQFYDLNKIYTPKDVKTLSVISNPDISTFWLLSSKDEIKTKKYVKSETDKIWYKIADLVKQWIINKDTASDLIAPVKELNNNLFEFKKMERSNPDMLKVKDYEWYTIQDYTNDYDNLRKEYLNTYIKKIKEYKWDKEKLENDTELSKLWDEISNIEWLLQTRMSLNSLETTNPIKQPLEFLDRVYTTAANYSKTWIWMAWRQLEWVYNKTFWKITWTHLEQWMWVQQDINKDWFIDNTANLTTDIASSVPMGLVGLNTFWKGANIFTTVAKNIAGNATINWVFNAAFDPWVSKETAYFDTITWPISDAVFYW